MKGHSSYPIERRLLCELLRLFYEKGWVSGTGGGICTVVEKPDVLMAPTGVHKERVTPQDLFVVNARSGKVILPPRNKSLRLSECSTIFCALINQKGAGSVMHSHALSAVLAADLAGISDHVMFESLEMLKGLHRASNLDKHPVPVIHNTIREHDLLEQVNSAISHSDFSRAYAILVRDHGAYIWGEDIWEAKRHAEVYHFLFEATVARKQRQPKG
ncbi:MAG: methylthioribulose 1-phosphate dehydratase [Nitrospira sp.]|nr:methylthioribulose 1-phosphate dehydratase [Nitrospira sp.]